MKIFADTSFLCALYREQDNSSDADQLSHHSPLPLFVSSLVLLEFRQGSRFECFRFLKDRTVGFPENELSKIFFHINKNIQDGSIEVEEVDWTEVFELAEKLSVRHTISGGHRTMDIIHVATALRAKADKLYTFDENQAKLAKRAGLKTNLR